MARPSIDSGARDGYDRATSAPPRCVEACLRRIDADNARLNAFILVMAE